MNTIPTLRRHGGFSVIELMVSVVIGMLAIMFATRLLVGAEQQKSASLGGSDTMQNGMLALFSLNSDAAQAGWGLNDTLINGCDTKMTDTQGFALTKVDRGGVEITPLAPVVIKNNGVRSDEISFYAGSSLSGLGNVGVGGVYNGGDVVQTNANGPYGFSAGDVLLVVPEPMPAAGLGLCSLAQLAATPVGRDFSIAANGNYRFNSGALGGGSYAAGVPTKKARIFNLGRGDKLSFHTWSVEDGVLRLRATELAGASKAPQTVVDNVIAIKAQYGFDSSIAFKADGLSMTEWSNVMIDADHNGITGDAGDYQRISAVRLAVVARGAVPEKPNAATGVCTATTKDLTMFESVAPAGVKAVPVTVKLDVENDPMDWKCYRYRAFETIVPIRNTGWRPI